MGSHQLEPPPPPPNPPKPPPPPPPPPPHPPPRNPPPPLGMNSGMQPPPPQPRRFRVRALMMKTTARMKRKRANGGITKLEFPPPGPTGVGGGRNDESSVKLKFSA